jgi:hypothetical protein
MTDAFFGERDAVGVQLGDFKAVQRPIEEVPEELASFMWAFSCEIRLGAADIP